jgi:hypothetical protein
MSMLGLTGETEKDDNLFKRLFWPSNHPNDVDTLGQQGFWICLVVGLISGVILLLTGHPLIALLTMVFMWLGGIGVREHSLAAAIFVAGAYVLNILVSLFAGVPPGALDIIISGLLLANIRGTYIAAAWQKKGALEDFPERLNTTFFDWLVDQLPAKLWPAGRFVFYVVGVLYVLLLVLGSFGLLMHRAYR